MRTWRLYNVLDGTYYPKLDDAQLEGVISRISSKEWDEWRLCQSTATEWTDLKKALRVSQAPVTAVTAKPAGPQEEKMEVVGLSTYVGHLQEPTLTKRRPLADFSKINIAEVEKRKIPRVTQKIPAFIDFGGKIFAAKAINFSPTAIRFDGKFDMVDGLTGTLIIQTKPPLQLRCKPLVREKELVRGNWSVALIEPGQNFELYVHFLETLKKNRRSKRAG